MKEKIKNLMKNKVFLGCITGVLVIAIIITTMLLLPKNMETLPVDTSPESSETASDVPDITVPSTDTTSDTASNTEETGIGDISVDVGGNTDFGTDSGTKSENPATPVNEVDPVKENNNGNTDNNNGGGITIGNPPVEEKYSCGCANHHCQNADYHTSLLNREMEGCPYCGSHSCPSFYAVNEWGYTTLDITLCPKYNEKSDPLKYCQECGKKPGDGSNGTCVQFLHACDCPNCGEHVEANTCHTCK